LKNLCGKVEHEILQVPSIAAIIRDGAGLLCGKLTGSCKKLHKIWVGGGYRGELLDWVKANFKFMLTVVYDLIGNPDLLCCRAARVVECTFAWLSQQRRLSKDYEVFPKTSETFILIAMTRLMLRRIQPL
jgi:putative transposase